MPSVQATYTLHVGWDAFGTDAFKLNHATYGKFDSVGKLYNPLTSAYGGANDSILPYVRSFVVDRGKDSNNDSVRPGTCLINLVDTAGLFNPKNASGALYNKLLPMRPIRIRGAYSSITYELFNGYIDTIDYDLETKSATITGYDAIQVLDQQSSPVLYPLSGVYTQQIMNLILLYSGIPEGNVFSYTANGDRIGLWPGMDGSRSSLQMIQDLLDVERGDFFVGKDGIFVYRARTYRTQGQSATAMPNGVTLRFKAGVNRELMRNRALVTREGGEPQEFVDEVSRATYGPLDESNLTSSLLNDDDHALSLAGFMVNRRKSAITQNQTCDIVANKSGTLMPAAMTRELGDLISIVESGNTGTYWVESIRHEVRDGGKFHLTTLGLSERRPNETPFKIGTSTIGGTDGLVWTQEV